MIIDYIENLAKYTNIPHVDDIATFLKNMNIDDLSEGDYPLKGEELYVKVLKYFPKNAKENNFETHEVYTDVQVIIKGEELIQIVPPDFLRKKIDYEIEGDFQFFSADNCILDIVVRKGQFIVFFPQEAHKPGCLYQDFKNPVMKLVFKAK